MFISVIAAYVIATAFAFCGVVNTVGYIMESEQGMGALLFIEGLAVAMWPLAVATALIMLVQIACLMERWLLLWTMSQAPAASPAPVPAPSTPKEAAPRVSVAATPPPTAPASSTMAGHLTAITPPVMPEAPAAPERPAPTVDTTPEPAPTPEKPQAADSTIPQTSAPKAEQASQSSPRQSALNFFKLD